MQSLNVDASPEEFAFRTAGGIRPPRTAARTSLGLAPNSRLKARLNSEASVKQSSSAIAEIDLAQAGSHNAAWLSKRRWRRM